MTGEKACKKAWEILILIFLTSLTVLLLLIIFKQFLQKYFFHSIEWWAYMRLISAFCMCTSLQLYFFIYNPSLNKREITIDRWKKRKCIHCGYDLQATPLKCPECGTVRPLYMS